MPLWPGVATAVLIAVATPCDAGPPRVGHPIIGTWRLYAQDGSCIETWEFRPDGTSHNYSGLEESTSRYTISDEPTAAGYYVLVDGIVETNGQPDCLGKTVPVGDLAVGYLVLAARDQFRLCLDLALSDCFTMVRAAKP